MRRLLSAFMLGVMAALALPATAETPAVQDWNSLKITLKRGPCFGTCPAYSVEISGDGAVTFHGGSFVAVPTTVQAQIDPAAVHALVDRFVQADFAGKVGNYQATITDNPTYRLSLSFDGHDFTVTDYVGQRAGMPPVISELENAVDETAGTEKWIVPNSQTVQLLKDAHWDFAGTDYTHQNLLRLAARANSADFLHGLLAAGARADDAYSCDALADAVHRGNVTNVQLLAESGAATSSPPNRWVCAPLVQAAGIPCRYDNEAGTDQLAMVKVMLDHGADVNARDLTGRSAIMVVGCAATARLLLAAGARDLNTPGGYEQMTALAQVCDRPTTEVLLQAGADPWITDKNGRNALQENVARCGETFASIAVLKAWMAAHPQPTKPH